MSKIVLFSRITFRSFCSSTNEKLNKLHEKLNKDANSPNSPIGIIDRMPKKDKIESTSAKSEEVYVDPYAKFPNNINPKTGEINGPTGPEPVRYGDWERRGRCYDF